MASIWLRVSGFVLLDAPLSSKLDIEGFRVFGIGACDIELPCSVWLLQLEAAADARCLLYCP